MPLQETLEHSVAGQAHSLMGSLGPGVHKVSYEPSERLWQVWGLILNTILPLLLTFGAFPLPLDVEHLFGGIQHSPVNSCSAASCSFGVLTHPSRLSS